MPSITTPELDAGKLDRLVTLLKPIYKDVYQDEISDWEVVAQVWAAVMPSVGVETDTGGRTQEVVTTTIQIRYRADIDARWRIQDGPVVYQIKGMLDILRRHVQWQLNCLEVE
jgi:SPP1 family predicted phage head-tail adaptor